VSYFYKPKTDAEIEQIAATILTRFAKRRLGLAIDIEAILEDLGLELLPRQGFRKYAEGYLASDPRYIVVDESILSYMPRARFTIAEEVCHLILEYRLWQGSHIPKGARGHELDGKQHLFVEKDAGSLASALLMPVATFTEVFHTKRRDLEATGAPALNVIRETLKQVADVFQVSPRAATRRTRKLRLISLDELKRLLPDC